MHALRLLLSNFLIQETHCTRNKVVEETGNKYMPVIALGTLLSLCLIIGMKENK